MAQTSDTISSLAASYATMTPDRLFGMTATDEGRRKVADDVRRMAASLLRQDEHKGLRGLVKRVFG